MIGSYTSFQSTSYSMYAPLCTAQEVEFEPTHAFHTPGELGWAVQVERAGS